MTSQLNPYDLDDCQSHQTETIGSFDISSHSAVICSFDSAFGPLKMTPVCFSVRKESRKSLTVVHLPFSSAVLRTAASRRPRCSTSTAVPRTIRPTCGRRAAWPASPRTSTSRVVACRRSSGSRPARARPPGPPTTMPAMDRRWVTFCNIFEKENKHKVLHCEDWNLMTQDKTKI